MSLGRARLLLDRLGHERPAREQACRTPSSMGERLKTFSAVFDGDPIDEQRYIAPVLEASGAESHFVRPQSAELFDDLALVVWHQDEPMVSSGPYAQYRVMQLAKGKAKVLLDGQGGDELLAGYVPYHYVYLRELLACPPSSAGQPRGGRGTRRPRPARAPADLRPAQGGRPRCALQRAPRRLGPGGVSSRRGPTRATTTSRHVSSRTSRPTASRRCSATRTATRWRTRSSRVRPFLDQELVELVLSLPPDAIVRDGWSRWILRESLSGVLPELVRTRRKKIGFTTPEIRWLRAQRAVVQGILRSPACCAAAVLGRPRGRAGVPGLLRR